MFFKEKDFICGAKDPNSERANVIHIPSKKGGMPCRPGCHRGISLGYLCNFVCIDHGRVLVMVTGRKPSRSSFVSTQPNLLIWVQPHPHSLTFSSNSISKVARDISCPTGINQEPVLARTIHRPVGAETLASSYRWCGRYGL